MESSVNFRWKMKFRSFNVWKCALQSSSGWRRQKRRTICWWKRPRGTERPPWTAGWEEATWPCPEAATPTSSWLNTSVRPGWRELILECRLNVATVWVCLHTHMLTQWLCWVRCTHLKQIPPLSSCRTSCLLCFRHQAGGSSSYIYADSSSPETFPAWSPEVQLNSRVLSGSNSSCVELLSTGAWACVECEATMFFMCQFAKSRRRGGRTGGWRMMSPLSTS